MADIKLQLVSLGQQIFSDLFTSFRMFAADPNNIATLLEMAMEQVEEAFGKIKSIKGQKCGEQKKQVVLRLLEEMIKLKPHPDPATQAKLVAWIRDQAPIAIDTIARASKGNVKINTPKKGIRSSCFGQ